MSRSGIAAALPPPLLTGPIDARRIAAFAEASGDANPIHLWDDAAREAGLPGAVIHGMFIAALFESWLERVPGARPRQLLVRFVRPCPAGSSLAISGRLLGAERESLHLRLMAKSAEGTLFAVAEARLDFSGGAHPVSSAQQEGEHRSRQDP
jgi:acyl dehydratase